MNRHTEIPDAYHAWLLELISLEETARLRGCSVDTVRREIGRGNLIAVDLSPRRKGVRRYAALMLPPP
jgi:hypothetical protein